MRPTYDIHLSYEDNYSKGPFFADTIPQRKITEKKTLLDFRLNSILGIPAGPLLNSNWIKLYAELGFDLLVYKTVRTARHPSHPAPNCMLLEVKGQLTPDRFHERLTATPEEKDRPVSEISITNSFGMPSRDPQVWQADVAKAKGYLTKGQLLIVSVVGTPGKGDLAEDYARGAALAREAGADIVEINLSCPNVVSEEGSLFANPHLSGEIARRVKEALGATPLFIKMGYVEDPALLKKVVRATAPHVQGISGINTLSFDVVRPDGTQALPGPGRLRSGVCGAAIRTCGLTQAKRIARQREKEKYDCVVVGVGGVMTPEDVQAYRDVGCDAVMTATGAMWDPFLAHAWWQRASR